MKSAEYKVANHSCIQCERGFYDTAGNGHKCRVYYPA